MTLVLVVLLVMALIYLGEAVYLKDRTYLIYANIYGAASLLAAGMID